MTMQEKKRGAMAALQVVNAMRPDLSEFAFDPAKFKQGTLENRHGCDGTNIDNNSQRNDN
jgi:hypothetical protein